MSNVLTVYDRFARNVSSLLSNDSLASQLFGKAPVCEAKLYEFSH